VLFHLGGVSSTTMFVMYGIITYCGASVGTENHNGWWLYGERLCASMEGTELHMTINELWWCSSSKGLLDQVHECAIKQVCL
jgi:hypothetical protein